MKLGLPRAAHNLIKVNTMWNSWSPCGGESVAERLSSHCWTSWLTLDKENLWQSTPAVAPDRWVQFALHNPPRCCSLLPLDGAAQNGLESKVPRRHPFNYFWSQTCLTSMITWHAVYSKSYRFRCPSVPVLVGHFLSQARSARQHLSSMAQQFFLEQYLLAQHSFSSQDSV